MNTYSYNLINLVTTDVITDRPQLVTYVWVEVTAQNADTQQSCVINYKFSLAPGDDFVPFDQLTEPQVRAWIDSQTERWDFIKAEMSAALEHQVQQPDFQVVDPPWIEQPPQILSTATTATSIDLSFNQVVKTEVMSVLTELGLINP